MRVHPLPHSRPPLTLHPSQHAPPHAQRPISRPLNLKPPDVHPPLARRLVEHVPQPADPLPRRGRPVNHDPQLLSDPTRARARPPQALLHPTDGDRAEQQVLRDVPEVVRDEGRRKERGGRVELGVEGRAGDIAQGVGEELR